jgi:nucleoside phosphorylase
MDINNQPIDILVYIALSEEFNHAKEEFGIELIPFEMPNIAITCFFGKVHSDYLQREFNLLVVPAGKMGNTRSSNVTSALLEKFEPDNIVVMGIAGSLTNDLQPGDVFIPDRVNEYLANSAAIGADNWEFQTSGNHFITSPRLINRFQLFSSTKKTYFENWKSSTVTNSNTLIDTQLQSSLKDSSIEIRDNCRLHVGDDKSLASGSAVGKGKAFVNWIKSDVDRKLIAIEMESAGVYDAALIRTPTPRAIAIRGISDFADERKEKIEAAAKEKFRLLSIKNSVSLLLAAIRAGLFSGII